MLMIEKLMERKVAEMEAMEKARTESGGAKNRRFVSDNALLQDMGVL